MATHDYVIDNSTGANVRADINNVLQAILTNNSSSSAPSTTAAYMWWADTTNGVLKIRNSANNDWVELLQLDGTLTLEDGSASTPALAFRDDLDTGIYSSASNTFNIATGGTERMELGTTTIFNEDGADVDFRIEGDNDANLFSLNAGTDKIGIGVASAGLKFHVQDGALASAPTPNSNCDVVIEGTTNTGIQFLSSTQVQLRFGDAASTAAGSIIYQHTDDNFRLNYSDFLSFNNGSGEAARIDSDGRVGIATTSPATDSKLTVDGKTSIRVADNAGYQTGLNCTNNANADFFVAIKSSSTSIGPSTSTPLCFHVNDHANERMRIDSSGNVGIGTSSPTEKLDVAGSIRCNTGTDISMDSNASGQLRFRGNAYTGAIALNNDAMHIYHNASARDLVFGVNASEKMRIDSSGRILTGHSSARASVGQIGDPHIQHEGLGSDDSSVSIIRNTNSNFAASLILGKSRGTSVGSNTIVANGDQLGTIRFAAADGTDVNSEAAFIQGRVDGTPGSNDTPGKLFFATTADGSDSATERMVIDSSGRVGIGTTSPSEKLNVSGNILATGTITPNSDIAFKKDIEPLTNVLNKVTQLLGINFTYKNNNEKSMGLVAQDVEKVFPELVRGEEGNKSLNYMGLTGALIEAIKELSAKVEALETA